MKEETDNEIFLRNRFASQQTKQFLKLVDVIVLA